MSRDPFVSYAQNQEDVVLAGAFRPDDRRAFEDAQNVRAT